MAAPWFRRVIRPLKSVLAGSRLASASPETLARAVLEALLREEHSVPTRVLDVFSHVQRCVQKRFAGAPIPDGIVGVALFLYFVTPCICNPFDFGVADAPVTNPKVLTLLARTGKEVQKVINNVASGKVSGPLEGIAAEFLKNLQSCRGVEVAAQVPSASAVAASEAVLMKLLERFAPVIDAALNADDPISVIREFGRKDRHLSLLSTASNVVLNVPQYVKVPEDYLADALAVESAIVTFFSHLDACSSAGISAMGSRFLLLPSTTFSNASNAVVLRMWQNLGCADATLFKHVVLSGDGGGGSGAGGGLVGGPRLEHLITGFFPFVAHCGLGRGTLLRGFPSLKFHMTDCFDESLLCAYAKGWFCTVLKIPCVVEYAAASGVFSVAKDDASQMLARSSSLSLLQVGDQEVFSESDRESAWSMLTSALNKRTQGSQRKHVSPSSSDKEMSIQRDPRRGIIESSRGGLRFILVSTDLITRCAYSLNTSSSLSAAANKTVAARLSLMGLSCGSRLVELIGMKTEDIGRGPTRRAAQQVCQILFEVGFGKLEVFAESETEKPNWIMMKTKVCFKITLKKKKKKKKNEHKTFTIRVLVNLFIGWMQRIFFLAPPRVCFWRRLFLLL